MPGYNLNPQPQAGSGSFGSVPGVIGLPNPAGNLAGQVPNLGSLNTAAGNDILSSLSGTLSPGTEHALQNAAATYGTASGMPGSPLSWNRLYGNIAGASESQQAQGLQELNPFLTQTSNTQTVSPTLQTEIAGTNASNAAAPNPSQAASYSENLFNQYLNMLKGPSSGGALFGSPASGGTYSQGNDAANPYSDYSVSLPYSPDFVGQDTSPYAAGSSGGF